MSGIEIVKDEISKPLTQKVISSLSDYNYKHGELCLVSASYVLAEFHRNLEVEHPPYFPFSLDLWNPTPENRIQELAKAGAFIVAEIDRLLSIKNNGKTEVPKFD